ncbi:MAG: hypothetical protein IH963_10245 [Chloroflexi bacterium]|nr:hypothetical protein [Chloroflexota bacterium]
MAEETWLKSLIKKRVKITLPSGNEHFGVLEAVEPDAIIVEEIWMNKAYLATVEEAPQPRGPKTTSITDSTYKQHLDREVQQGG